jgi:hypothetical protein
MWSFALCHISRRCDLMELCRMMGCDMVRTGRDMNHEGLIALSDDFAGTRTAS